MTNKVTVKAPKVSTYPVTGNTLEEVWGVIQKKGPKDPNDGKKVAAITETMIEVDDYWEPEVRGGRCMTDGTIETRVGVGKMTMTVTGTIKLPKLGTNKLSKAAKKEWDRFRKELESHEREHVTITEKLAKTMGDEIHKIEGLGKGDTEDKAFEAGKDAFIKAYLKSFSGKQIADRVSAEHKKFDGKTNHGPTLKTSIK